MADEQSAAFFQPMDDNTPIVLGAPDENAGEYIGEIDAAPPAVLIPEADEPVLMMPPPAEEPMVLAPEEPLILAPGVEEVEEDVIVPEAADYSAAPIVEREESPMAQWNAGWQVTLAERKDVENSTKATQLATAEEERSTFQAQMDAKREAKMAKNRSEEQDKLEAMETDLEQDNSWQRVNKLVELQQDGGESGVDVTRMRDVLIFLKNDVDRAAILA